MPKEGGAVNVEVGGWVGKETKSGTSAGEGGLLHHGTRRQAVVRA